MTATQQCRIESDGGGHYDGAIHSQQPRTWYVITPDGERVDARDKKHAKRVAERLDQHYARPDREKTEHDILTIINEHGDPSMDMLKRHADGDDIEQTVYVLMDLGAVRQKECSVDHEWTYRMTLEGRRRLTWLAEHLLQADGLWAVDKPKLRHKQDAYEQAQKDSTFWYFDASHPITVNPDSAMRHSCGGIEPTGNFTAYEIAREYRIIFKLHWNALLSMDMASLNIEGVNPRRQDCEAVRKFKNVGHY